MSYFNLFKSKKSSKPKKGNQHTQAFRIVHRTQPLNNSTNSSSSSNSNSTTSLSLQSTEEILHIDCHIDPATKKGFILWDDIQQVCSDVVYVRNENRVVSYLKGADSRPLEPRRIAAVPNVVLDVVAGGESLADPAPNVPANSVHSSPPQPGRTDQDESPLLTESRTSIETPPLTVATVRNPVEGDPCTAMANYNHIDHTGNPGTPLTCPRGPHVLLEGGQSTQDQQHEGTHRGPSDDDENEDDDDDDKLNFMPILVKASMGDAGSQVTMGDIYRGGIGVPQDFAAAMSWYQKAALKNHSQAQYHVGIMYEQGWGGVEKDHTKALEWFLKASIQGVPEAQFQAARAYAEGLGVEKDLSKAIEWLHKASEQGHAYSQFSLAAAYAEGTGVPKDVVKSTAWALKAAKQGHVPAQRLVGLMYEIGQGVPKDIGKAREWYLKAVVQGSADAKRSLVRLRG
ncbi:hypothetical protein BGW39_004155 [Mortierella sp. 14UC]|nr:hypothetical protein BGW39_004155 [Mortierella sp. 14UC]